MGTNCSEVGGTVIGQQANDTTPLPAALATFWPTCQNSQTTLLVHQRQKLTVAASLRVLGHRVGLWGLSHYIHPRQSVRHPQGPFVESIDQHLASTIELTNIIKNSEDKRMVTCACMKLLSRFVSIIESISHRQLLKCPGVKASVFRDLRNSMD